MCINPKNKGEFAFAWNQLGYRVVYGKVFTLIVGDRGKRNRINSAYAAKDMLPGGITLDTGWDGWQFEDQDRIDAGPSDYLRRIWQKGKVAPNVGIQERVDEDDFQVARGEDVERSEDRESSEVDREERSDEVPHAGRQQNIRRSHRRKSKLPITSFLIPFLATLPFTSAAPPLPRPSASGSHQTLPTQEPQLPTSVPPRRRLSTRKRGYPALRDITNNIAPPSPDRRDVLYITSAAPPAAYPSQVLTVAETALPLLFTQGSDGYYSRDDNGWNLYGRQSAVSNPST